MLIKTQSCLTLGFDWIEFSPEFGPCFLSAFCYAVTSSSHVLPLFLKSVFKGELSYRGATRFKPWKAKEPEPWSIHLHGQQIISSWCLDLCLSCRTLCRSSRLKNYVENQRVLPWAEQPGQGDLQMAPGDGSSRSLSFALTTFHG